MENTGELTAHITSGAMIVYGIEWAKSSGLFPWITADTKTLNRVASAVCAAAVAFGISMSYDPAVGGDIHIPSLSALAPGAYEFLKQFVIQQLVFDGVVKTDAAKTPDTGVVLTDVGVVKAK